MVGLFPYLDGEAAVHSLRLAVAAAGIPEEGCDHSTSADRTSDADGAGTGCELALPRREPGIQSLEFSEHHQPPGDSGVEKVNFGTQENPSWGSSPSTILGRLIATPRPPPCSSICAPQLHAHDHAWY